MSEEKNMKLSEELSAMALTLIGQYQIGEFLQLKMNEFINDAKILEAKIKACEHNKQPDTSSKLNLADVTNRGCILDVILVIVFLILMILVVIGGIRGW